MNPIRTLAVYTHHLTWAHGFGTALAFYPGLHWIRQRGWFKRLSAHVKPLVRFGPARGMLINRALAVGASRLPVPGLTEPLRVRPGSSDGKAFRHVFIDQAYRVRLPVNTPRFMIDAGANVGFASVYLASKYPSATICAVEPDEGNFAELLLNTQPYPGIVPLRSALWGRRDKSLTIDNPGGSAWAFQVRETRAGEEGVPAVTIRELLDKHGHRTIDFLKIDVEGAEEYIFAEDCSDWLPRVRVLVIELHDWLRPSCSAPFRAAMARYRFQSLTNGEDMILFNQDID